MPFGRVRTEQQDGHAPADGQAPQADRAIDGAGDQRPDTADRPAARGDAFFICVGGENGTATHRFEDLSAAQTFAEQLLEQGVPEEQVTAFSGRRVGMEVTHRPVVHLASTREE